MYRTSQFVSELVLHIKSPIKWELIEMHLFSPKDFEKQNILASSSIRRLIWVPWVPPINERQKTKNSRSFQKNSYSSSTILVSHGTSNNTFVQQPGVLRSTHSGQQYSRQFEKNQANLLTYSSECVRRYGQNGLNILSLLTSMCQSSTWLGSNPNHQTFTWKPAPCWVKRYHLMSFNFFIKSRPALNSFLFPTSLHQESITFGLRFLLCGCFKLSAHQTIRWWAVPVWWVTDRCHAISFLHHYNRSRITSQRLKLFVLTESKARLRRCWNWVE